MSDEIKAQLNGDELSLEEKLDLLDRALASAQNETNERARAKGEVYIPTDPADLTMCTGCQ